MPAQAEAFAKAIKASGVKGLALAGRPGEDEAKWRAAGVDDFIFAGADAVATLAGPLSAHRGLDGRPGE